MAVEAAAEVKRLFDEVGIRPYIKTSGSRGLHVYVRLLPRWDSYEVRSAAVAVARELERRRPDLITAQWWKVERGERIFIDFNQNAPHKTVFAPWSVRAFDLATVSCPFGWDELASVNPLERTIATVPAIVAERGDAWADDGRRAAVAGAAVGDGPRRRGAGVARCPVAAGVPEDAGRAASRRPEAAPRYRLKCRAS